MLVNGRDSFEDYLQSSYANPSGSGRDRNHTNGGKSMLMNSNMGPGPGGVSGGLGALQPQKSPTRMSNAVPSQVGPNPMKANGGSAPAFGGLTNPLSPVTGMSPAGPLHEPAMLGNPVIPRPVLQNPIKRSELGMGAVERGVGFGGLDGVRPQQTPTY